MSETQKQNITNINEILYKLSEKEISIANSFFENMINMKLLALCPDAILENMDTTEKLMLIDYYSKSEEERKKDEEDAIPLEECLKKAGLTIDDLHD